MSTDHEIWTYMDWTFWLFWHAISRPSEFAPFRRKTTVLGEVEI